MVSYLANTFPEVRYFVAFASGVVLANVSKVLRERVWVCLTSDQVLFVTKTRLRPPTLLLSQPAGLMRPARYQRHTKITSQVSWALPDGRTFTVRGGTRFTELMDALTAQRPLPLAD